MSKPDNDKFDVVIKWAIKIAAVVFTAPASWEVAGGLYPAIQASRMDVVSALRFE